MNYPITPNPASKHVCISKARANQLKDKYFAWSKSHSSLTEEHRRQFLARGFSERDVWEMEAAGLRSVTPEELPNLGYKYQGKAIECGGWIFQPRPSIGDVYIDEIDWEDVHSSSQFLDTAIPRPESFIQFHPDDPTYPKYLNPAGYKAKIHLPIGANWVTEGIADGFACSLLGGIPMGICAGVSHYKAAEANSGLSWIFDSDGWRNPQVFSNLFKAAKHTGGKVQLFPTVTPKDKDGAEEFFKAGHTGDDLKALLDNAFSPEDFLFELPTHWDKLSGSKKAECAKKVIQLAVEHLDPMVHSRLWGSIAKAVGATKRDVEKSALQLQKQVDRKRKAESKGDDDKTLLLRQRDAIIEAAGDDLKLNTLTQAIEFQGRPINPGRYKTFVAELINQTIPREDCTELLGAIAENNAYSPVKDYLERCYLQYGDSTVGILEDAATRLLNPSQPLDIYNTYLRRWMIGAVARAFEPGCKFDHVLILQGRQGLFKSTFFRLLAGDQFFDDNLGDLANIKDELLLLHMAWIHEWAEFDRVTGKREMSIVKSFVTRTEDRFRAPYDRAAMGHKRASVLCGTVNENQFLVDDENRRFWVVPIASPVDIEMVRAERDKLWAAAVALYKRGELPTLSRDESLLNSEINATFQHEDTWESAIAKFLTDTSYTYRDANEDRYFRLADVLTHGLKIDLEKQNRKTQGRVRKILIKLGCESAGSTVRLLGLGSVRCWKYPQTTSHPVTARDTAILGNESGTLVHTNVTHTSHPVTARDTAILGNESDRERHKNVTSSQGKDSSHSVTVVTLNSRKNSEVEKNEESTESSSSDSDTSVFSNTGVIGDENNVTSVTPLHSNGSSPVTCQSSTQGTSHPITATVPAIPESSTSQATQASQTLEPSQGKDVTLVPLNTTHPDGLYVSEDSTGQHKEFEERLIAAETTQQLAQAKVDFPDTVKDVVRERWEKDGRYEALKRKGRRLLESEQSKE